MDTGDLPTMHIPFAHQPYGGTDGDSPIAIPRSPIGVCRRPL